ncbi:hypothetical protein [Nocardia xishanensis]|uniref:hypothetical protein n=1 Tax=Nocardia xishanensis TaxID=238964 RepID=UPI0012F4C816|nr:hypothetical protein [Nocardia xishanensis]
MSNIETIRWREAQAAYEMQNVRYTAAIPWGLLPERSRAAWLASLDCRTTMFLTVGGLGETHVYDFIQKVGAHAESFSWEPTPYAAPIGCVYIADVANFTGDIRALLDEQRWTAPELVSLTMFRENHGHWTVHTYRPKFWTQYDIGQMREIVTQPQDLPQTAAVERTVSAEEIEKFYAGKHSRWDNPFDRLSDVSPELCAAYAEIDRLNSELEYALATADRETA